MIGADALNQGKIIYLYLHYLPIPVFFFFLAHNPYFRGVTYGSPKRIRKATTQSKQKKKIVCTQEKKRSQAPSTLQEWLVGPDYAARTAQMQRWRRRKSKGREKKNEKKKKKNTGGQRSIAWTCATSTSPICHGVSACMSCICSVLAFLLTTCSCIMTSCMQYVCMCVCTIRILVF